MSEQEKDGSMPEVRAGQTWSWRGIATVVTLEELDADEGLWKVQHEVREDPGFMYLAESTRKSWTLIEDVA